MVYVIEGLEGVIVYGTQVLSDEVVEQEGLGVGAGFGGCGADDYKPQAAAECE